MTSTRSGRGLCVLVLAVVVVATVARAQDEPAAPDDGTASAEPLPEVVVEGDRVTATFTKVAPATIVQAIAAAAGAQVTGDPEAADPTSVDLEDVPIDRAIARALRGQSFTIVYGGDGRVRSIQLHGGPQATPERGRLIARKPPTSAGSSMSASQLLNVEVKVPSVGPLAEYLGKDTATLGQLYKIAVGQDQAALRIAAVDASMAAIETDASLQAGVQGALDSTDDASLVAILRGSAGNRANELVSRILSRTRRPQVRQRAVTLLRALRQPAN